MPSKRPKANPSLLAWAPAYMKAWEIAWAAPQVVAYRLSRMMLGGWPPSARDRREYTRMGQEKADAWLQMWTAAALAWPLTSAKALEKTLAPVHHRVVANNRRLAKG